MDVAHRVGLDFRQGVFRFGMSTDTTAMMGGGLCWLDAESNSRFGKTFIEVTDAQRTALVDDIAYPRKASPALSHGVAFFSRFRDALASGFFTSKIGVTDRTQAAVWAVRKNLV